MPHRATVPGRQVSYVPVSPSHTDPPCSGTHRPSNTFGSSDRSSAAHHTDSALGAPSVRSAPSQISVRLRTSARSPCTPITRPGGPGSDTAPRESARRSAATQRFRPRVDREHMKPVVRQRIGGFARQADQGGRSPRSDRTIAWSAPTGCRTIAGPDQQKAPRSTFSRLKPVDRHSVRAPDTARSLTVPFAPSRSSANHAAGPGRPGRQ